MIGILEHSLYQKAADIILQHPAVNKVDNTSDALKIECSDWGALTEWLQRNHGLYLIVGAKGYHIGSIIEETLSDDPILDEAVNELLEDIIPAQTVTPTDKDGAVNDLAVGAKFDVKPVKAPKKPGADPSRQEAVKGQIKGKIAAAQDTLKKQGIVDLEKYLKTLDSTSLKEFYKAFADPKFSGKPTTGAINA